MARRAGRLIDTLAMALTAAIVSVSCGGEADEPARAIDADADSGAIARQPASENEDGSEDRDGSDSGDPDADEAVELYLASNEFMEEALRAPDPADPRLADYFSGAALNETSNLLLTARQNLEYYESSLDGDPTIVTSDAAEVVLSDCVSETSTTFDAESGQSKGSGSNVSNWEIRLLATGAGWRVDQITPREEPCTP